MPADQPTIATLQQENAQLRQRVAELEHEAQHCHKILEAAPALLYVYDLRAQRNTYANRELAKLLGHDPSAIQGLTEGGLAALMHPDDMARFPAHMSELHSLHDEDTLVFVYRMRHADGSWRWMQSNDAIFARDAAGTPTQIIGAVQDITEQRQTAERLQQTQSLLQGIVDHLPAALFVKDLDGNFLLVNQFAAAMSHSTPADMVGINEYTLMPTQVAESIQAKDRQVVETGVPHEDEDYVLLEDKHYVFASIRLPIRDAQGTIYATGGIALDRTEQKQQEEALRQNEARHRALLDALPDMMFIQRSDSTFLDYRAPRSGLMLDPEQFIGKRNTEVFPPDLAQRFNEAIQQALASRQIQLVEYMLPYGDTPRYFEARISPIDNDTVMALVRDITEQKEQQQALRMFKFAVENISDGVHWLGPDSRNLYVNQAFCRNLGYSREDLLQMTLDQFDPDVTPEIWSEQLWPLIRQQGSLNTEARHQRKDGSIFPVEVTANYIASEEREYVVVFVRDITARKQQEDELHTNQELLRHVIDHSPAIIYVKDQAGRYRLVNRQFLQMPLIRHLDTVIGKTDADFMPPDIAAIIGQNDQDIIARGHAVQLDEEVPQEDGMHSYIATKFPMYDAAGRYIGLGGISTDITERKRQERDLRTFKTVIEHAPSGISLADPSGKMTYVNRALCEMLGYDDMQGMLIFDAFPAEDHAEIAAVAQEVAQGAWQGVLTYLRADGTRFPGQVSAFSIADENGEIELLAALTTDITVIKQAEAERAALQQQVIDAQRHALRELSTPLIPISDNVVIMPLIGAIDSLRAQQVMETLLEGVAQHHASLVILDITGVSVVDTQVAQAFIQAAQAVRLLGARVMLTGIQPQIAQTLVQLGVDLSGIQTQGSLQAGIAAAIRGAR